MCYAAPGPRCYSHAKETYDAKEKAFVDASIVAVKTGSPEAQSKAEKAKADLLKAKTDVNTSSVGIGKLKEELAKKVTDGEITENQALLEYREARDERGKRMLAYDEAYKTVDGKKPSSFWNNSTVMKNKLAEMERIRGRIKDLRHNGGRSKENLKKVEAQKQKLEAVAKQVRHALATQSHVENGVITAEEATNPPAAPFAPREPSLRDQPTMFDYINKARRDDTIPKKRPTAKPTNNRKPQPHLPEPVKDEGNGHWVGSKYDRTRTNQQVAIETRSDIKKAVATGALPSEYSYKVKNKENRIEVDVIGDHSANIDVQQRLDGYPGIVRDSHAGLELKRKVSAYPRQYAYYRSDPQFDNFNSSHSIFVNLIDSKTGKNVKF